MNLGLNQVSFAVSVSLLSSLVVRRAENQTSDRTGKCARQLQHFFFFSNITTLKIQKECIPPQRPNNPAMIKPIPISHKLYLNPLDLDFYLDLQQFVLTGKYQPSRCSWLKKKVKIYALIRNENALAPCLCSDPHQKNCRPILHSSFVNICLLVFV